MDLEIKATANGEAELHIYGVIGKEENNPKDLISRLKSIKSETLHVHINSPGGDLFTGHAIYGIIKNFKGHKITYIDGLAASAASIIAMAGDKVVMPRNTLLMIHNASTVIYGDSQEFAKAAETLEKMNATMQTVYHDKTGMAHSEIATMMNNETWFTADEALKLGFVDMVIDDIELDSHYESNGNLILNGIDFGNAYAEKIKHHLPPPATSPVANFLSKEGAHVMLTVEAFQKEHKATYDEVYTAAYQAGQTAERARIKEIEELEALGHKDILAKAKFDTGATAADVSFLIMKAEAQQRKTHIKNVMADAGAVNKITSTQTDPAGNTQEEKEDAAFLAVFEGSNK